MMKRILGIAFFIFTTISITGQITSPAYIINLEGDTISGEIIDFEWKNTPQQIEFKSSIEGNFKKLNPNNFTLLVINNFRRIRSAEVFYGDVNGLSTGLDITTIYSKRIFVEDVIIGQYNLFVFRNENEPEFFYSEKNDSIKRLEFYNYTNLWKSTAPKVRDIYKYQLWDFKKCADKGAERINELTYSIKPLSNYFEKLNKCNGFDFINHEKLRKENTKKTEFRLRLKGGIDYARFNLNNEVIPQRSTRFQNSTDLHISAELEFLLPYNNYHFSIVTNPNFNRYKGEEDVYLIENKTMKVEADFSFLELPIGVRYYLKSAEQHLNNKHNYFVDLVLNSRFSLDGGVVSERDKILKETYDINFMFGGAIGYLYQNKLSVEIRSGIRSDMMTRSTAWNGYYQKTSFVMGYRIYNSKN